MTGPWKAWKSKNRFPTLSTVPWNLAKTRDSHIPTAARDDDSGSLSENQRKEVGRCAAILRADLAVSLRISSCDRRMWLNNTNRTVQLGRSPSIWTSPSVIAAV